MGNGTRIIVLLFIALACVPVFARGADPADDCNRDGQELCGEETLSSGHDPRAEEQLQTRIVDREIQREMNRDSEKMETKLKKRMYRPSDRERDADMLENLLLESTGSGTVPVRSGATR